MENTKSGNWIIIYSNPNLLRFWLAKMQEVRMWQAIITEPNKATEWN